LNTETNKLKELVKTIHPLSEAGWESFASCWKPKTFGRKETVTAIGDTERYLYFVLDGVQRVYYADEHDREATLVFTYTPSFGGVLDSFLLQQPSPYFYETLTPSTFLRASYTDIENLMQTDRDVEAFIRKGVSMATSGVLTRLVELQCFTAEDRFRSLLKRSPHLLHLVPHKYIANYLGMDATNFSKFITRIKI
jgi:CRP-like cAMP-binding protein